MSTLPGADVALAALRRPVPDRRADRPAGHARRRDEHGEAEAADAAEPAKHERAPLGMLNVMAYGGKRRRATPRPAHARDEARRRARRRRARRAPAPAARARRSRRRRAAPRDLVGGQPAAELRPRRAAQRGGRARARARSESSGSGPQSATRPPAIQNASKRAGRRRVRREHEPRARVRRAQHAAEPAEQRLEPRAAALAARRRARSCAPRRRRASARRCGRAARAPPSRRVDEQAAAPRRAARGRGSGRGRRGRARGSGPSGRRRSDGRGAASLRPQWRRPNSELSCSTSSAAAARPRTGPTVTACPARRLARDLEDRERDVEPAAQVDVAVGAPLAAHVARRPQRLDQPVLEQERAELGLRRLVVDVLGLAGPVGGRREVRARARAQADRLADVERAAVGVAEDVDAGVLGQRGEVRALLGARRRRRARRRPARRRARRGAGRAARPPRRPSRRARIRRANSAQNTRAQVSASGQRAVGHLDLDPERVGERGEAAAALQRREAARHRDRAQHRRLGPVERRARERAAQHAAGRSAPSARRARGRAAAGELGQHRLGRRRVVDHRLRDPGEALDPARRAAPRRRRARTSGRAARRRRPAPRRPRSARSARARARSSPCRRRGTPRVASGCVRRSAAASRCSCERSFIRPRPDGMQRACRPCTRIPGIGVPRGHAVASVHARGPLAALVPGRRRLRRDGERTPNKRPRRRRRSTSRRRSSTAASRSPRARSAPARSA